MKGPIIALAVGIGLGFWFDSPPPPPKPETVTVTERVEVPGPEVVRYQQVPLPDSCTRMLTLLDDANTAIHGYSAASARFVPLLNDGAGAVAMSDSGRINETITSFYQMSSATSPFLADLTEAADRLTAVQQQCLADMED